MAPSLKNAPRAFVWRQIANRSIFVSQIGVIDLVAVPVTHVENTIVMREKREGEYRVAVGAGDLLRLAAVDGDHVCIVDPGFIAREQYMFLVMREGAPPDRCRVHELLYRIRAHLPVAAALTTENHQGTGCNILFVDGHVEFIRSEDISNLKWQ